MTSLHQLTGLRQRFTLTAACLAATASVGLAHIGYTGRNFSADPNFGTAPVTISNQTVTGSYGWADGTDSDYGDSHKLRAFRFTLTYDALVTVSVRDTAIGATSSAGLLPGFSIYGGLAHLSPQAPDHDFAAQSVANRPVGTEGSFRALSDWTVWNDSDEETAFTFEGAAADGSVSNFGGAAGIIGDGLADGFISASFSLAPGDYTLFVGGADYAAGALGASTSYGINTTLNVVPVPEPSAAGLAGLAVTGLLLRRRNRR